MAFGYNPYIAKWSPYHGAQYAIVEAISKVVAAGARYNNMRFSYQEFFERMTNEHSWGKPLAALLGALKMQTEFGLPSIGGKDSMSGTFNDSLSVPPMLMAFGITTVNANTVISPDFKSRGHKLYLVKHVEKEDYTPNVEQLMENFEFVSHNIEKGKIVSAYALGHGGLIEALAKCSFGNQTGFYVKYDEKELDRFNYGSILIEVAGSLDYPKDCEPNVMHIGRTSHFHIGVIIFLCFCI
jgi:phosphoribosylformylglycinamidine synthase